METANIKSSIVNPYGQCPSLISLNGTGFGRTVCTILTTSKAATPFITQYNAIRVREFAWEATLDDE